MADNINLFWARTELEKPYINFGDALSAIVVAGLSNKEVIHAPSESQDSRMAAIGTVGHTILHGHCKIWGTGFDASINRSKPSVNHYTLPSNTMLEVCATRGRFSELLLQSQGIETTGIYGDPGWFAKYMVKEEVYKDWELGIIVHISELETHGLEAKVNIEFERYKIPEYLQDKVKIIHTYSERNVDGVLDKIREIKSCRRILSTSLHGLVIAEMFNIPCAWFGLSNYGGIKTPLYVYEASMPLDHRVRDFYTSTESHDYALTYHAHRDKVFDYEKAIDYLDKEWKPVDYNDSALFNAFPYLDIKHPNLININSIKNNLKKIVL